MNIKKLLVALLAAAMMLMALASCSEESATSTETQDEADTSAVTSEEATGEEAVEDEEEYVPMFHSDYFTDDGYFDGVNAADYVTYDDYADFEVPEDVLVVDDATIEAEFDSLLNAYMESNIIDDESYVVEDGDTLNIDYVGSVDGVEFDGGSTQGQGTEVTIGVTSYIDGFLDQLIGRKVGENFDIDVTFPDDYGSTDLAGKDAVFNITINNAIEYVEPELTDELIEEATQGTHTTVEGFEQFLIDSYAESQKYSYLNEAIIADATFNELPESVVQYQNDAIVDEISLMASQYGMEVEDVLLQFGLEDIDQLLENEVESIERNVKHMLVIQYIAEKEGIVVETSDIDEFFDGSDWTVYEEQLGENYIKSIVMTEMVYSLY